MAEVEVTGDATAVEADVGDEVVLRLPENATTGYVWSVHSMGDGLTLVGDTMAPGGDAPGAAGARVMRMRVVGMRGTEVVLRLGRPWEPGPAEERRIAIEVKR
jgi:inhibitor of cysteine peptidase